MDTLGKMIIDGQLLQRLTTKCCTDTQVDQNNYPEMLGKTAIINAGAVINFVFPLVKPFLDKRTQNKIEVCPCGLLSEPSSTALRSLA